MQGISKSLRPQCVCLSTLISDVSTHRSINDDNDLLPPTVYMQGVLEPETAVGVSVTAHIDGAPQGTAHSVVANQVSSLAHAEHWQMHVKRPCYRVCYVKP